MGWKKSLQRVFFIWFLGIVMDWKEIKKWQEFADRYVVIERQLGGPPNYRQPSILRYVPTRTTDRTEIEKC